jgi:hypothetical protein
MDIERKGCIVLKGRSVMAKGLRSAQKVCWSLENKFRTWLIKLYLSKLPRHDFRLTLLTKLSLILTTKINHAHHSSRVLFFSAFALGSCYSKKYVLCSIVSCTQLHFRWWSISVLGYIATYFSIGSLFNWK